MRLQIRCRLFIFQQLRRVYVDVKAADWRIPQIVADAHIEAFQLSKSEIEIIILNIVDCADYLRTNRGQTHNIRIAASTLPLEQIEQNLVLRALNADHAFGTQRPIIHRQGKVTPRLYDDAGRQSFPTFGSQVLIACPNLKSANASTGCRRVKAARRKVGAGVCNLCSRAIKLR